MNINTLKNGCIGLWLPCCNTYAMMDMGLYDGTTFTTNNKLTDISGHGNHMTVSQWTAAARINYNYLVSTANTRINNADIKMNIFDDYTVIAKRTLITDNVTSYGFGAQFANDNSTIMFENRAKVSGVWRGSVKSLGVVSYVDLVDDGWSYQQKDNYNGIEIQYGNQTAVKTGLNFSRLRMLWKNVECVAFWNRRLSIEEINQFEDLFDRGVLYQIWTGKNIYNYITELNVNNNLIEVAPTDKAKSTNYAVKSKDTTITTEDYDVEQTCYRYKDELFSIKQTSKNIVATKNEMSKTTETYTVETSEDYKTLFPDIDFLLCPKIEGITDNDLENGKWFTNLASDKYNVVLTNSSKLIYKDKRLVHLDNRKWITYKVDDVEDDAPLWSTFPYSMLGCTSYQCGEQNNYTIAFIWRRKSWVRVGEEQTYNIWNGVELQQNNQNWNATGMQHFIDATRINNDQFPDRVTLGFCMNSLFNYYPADMFNDIEQDYLLCLSYNCTKDSIYPRCQWQIINLSSEKDGEIHYNCRGQNTRPVSPVNIYFRSVVNNSGSVGLLAAMPRGLNNEEFQTFVECFKRLYYNKLSQ